MNIEDFRLDFIARQEKTGLTQLEISRLYGVNQPLISRFLSGNRGIGIKPMIKLWAFVYGVPFPAQPSSKDNNDVA